MPLKVSDGIRTWIDDFQKSDAPQFKGKTKDERRDQAIAAYLSAKKGPKNEDAAMDKARADFFKKGGKIKKFPAGPKYGHLDTNIAKGVKGLVRTKKLGLKGHGKHLDTSTPVHKDDEKTNEGMKKKTGFFDDKIKKDVQNMAKDPKYKGNTTKFHNAIRKKHGDGNADHFVIQNIIRKHAETNENAVSEVSVNTLKNYIRRSAMDKSARDYTAGFQRGQNQLGLKHRVDSERKSKNRMGGIVTAADKLARKIQKTNEATNFAVSIEGLPQMFMSADSPGMLKQELRKIVKQPSMIQGVKRVTDAMVKKTFRLKAQGRDEEEQQENYKYDYGSPESIKLMKKITPGQGNTKTEKTYMRTDKRLPNLKVPVKRKLKNLTLAKKIMGQEPKKLKTVADHVKFLEAKDPNEYDKEGSMMKSQLRQIMSANDSLMKMVKDDDNLPEWVQSKITKATDYIRSVRDYLESEKNA